MMRPRDVRGARVTMLVLVVACATPNQTSDEHVLAAPSTVARVAASTIYGGRAVGQPGARDLSADETGGPPPVGTTVTLPVGGGVVVEVDIATGKFELTVDGAVSGPMRHCFFSSRTRVDSCYACPIIDPWARLQCTRHTPLA